MISVSCIELAIWFATDNESADLVLVDSPLSIHSDNMKNISQGSFPVLPRDPKDKPTPFDWHIFDAFSTLQRVSTNFSIPDVSYYFGSNLLAFAADHWYIWHEHQRSHRWRSGELVGLLDRSPGWWYSYVCHLLVFQVVASMERLPAGDTG